MSILYVVLIRNSDLNGYSYKNLMQKKLFNFFYLLLIKIAENYYGESIKIEEEVPYSNYF